MQPIKSADEKTKKPLLMTRIAIHQVQRTGAKPAASIATPARFQRMYVYGGIAGPSGEHEECHKNRLQRKTPNSELETGNDSAVPQIVHEALRSPGQPLDADTRALMESRLRHDFSQVRVHTDGKAAESARAVNAVAYTVREDIAFDVGKYAPENKDGQQLLVHELAHVVQQSRGSSLAPSNLSNSSSEQAAEQAATDFSQASRAIQICGATAHGLARQRTTNATKPKPTIDVNVTKQAGRTVITVNGVTIAESSDVLPEEIELFSSWTPENLTIVVVSPEGKKVFAIPGSNTETALSKLSSHFSLQIRERLKVPQRTFNELEGRYGPLEEFKTTDTLTGERPKALPPRRAPVPPKLPPQSAPPPKQPQPNASITTGTASSVQFFQPPPVNIDLPPPAKYGKPKTEKEVGEERINKIIRDAIAGRSDIPPSPKGMEPKSLIEAIKQGIADGVKPLIKNLPKDARDFILEKIDSAIEKGVAGIADAALDATTLDDKTKASIKRAIEAGMKLKPSQSKTE